MHAWYKIHVTRRIGSKPSCQHIPASRCQGRCARSPTHPHLGFIAPALGKHWPQRAVNEPAHQNLPHALPRIALVEAAAVVVTRLQ